MEIIEPIDQSTKHLGQIELFNLDRLKMYRKMAKTDPFRYLPFVVDILEKLGDGYASAGRPEKLIDKTTTIKKAISNYTEIPSLLQILIQKEPKKYCEKLAEIQHKIGIHQTAINQFDDAESRYLEALAIYKDIIQFDPVLLLPKLAQTLKCLAQNHIQKDEIFQAIKCYQNALPIFTALIEFDDERFVAEVAATNQTIERLEKAKINVL